MGKRYSKQAWISREGPEGDCVIENDTTNSSTVSQGTAEELCKAPSSHTADFTYKGYPVNLEEPFEVEKTDPKKCFFYDDYPLEVVELPDLPDGKKIELRFDREGLVEASTQTTKPLRELSECGMSVKSTGSDHQEWSYTLYDFEGKGHVTRDDLKNLVKSIYEVIGKSVSQSKNHPKDPLKKLKIRLSVSKERGKATDNAEPSTCHEYVISAVTSQDHSKKTRNRTFHVERCDSMTVNPPSPESLMSIDKLQTIMQERTPVEGLDRGHMQRTVCKKCDQGRKNKPPILHDSAQRNALIDPKGVYQCPKRMQTGPGECNPPSPRETDLCRVRDWLSKLCEPHDGHEFERTESRHRHRKSRHHSCRQEPCERDFDLHRCPQYLDLATDHASYPYHVQSHACLYSNSPRLPRRPKHSKAHHNSCKQQREESCPNRRTIVHQHEHHHHHNHHHYHHYAE
ncbi:hypothetical protein QZH41_017968 [Actinostola sp. cb2023]|nr:hypothetical protein QZH41_017968 [Actinostola sp. cb2023]